MPQMKKEIQSKDKNKSFEIVYYLDHWSSMFFFFFIYISLKISKENILFFSLDQPFDPSVVELFIERIVRLKQPRLHIFKVKNSL